MSFSVRSTKEYIILHNIICNKYENVASGANTKKVSFGRQIYAGLHHLYEENLLALLSLYHMTTLYIGLAEGMNS